MYPVSADYITAMSKNARAAIITGVAGAHTFDGDDVIKDTFAVRNQFCPATEIELGGVYVGELDLTFTAEFAESLNIRGSWRGVQITASIGIELADGTFESVPLPGGTYTVDEATWTNNGLEIVAYDNMSKFDKALNMDQSSGSLYSFLTWACGRCGVTFGMSAIEVAALTNGTRVISMYPDESIETFRDMISKLAQMACCFCTINRTGQLILVPLPAYTDVTATVPAKLRYSTSFSDYETYYDTVTCVDVASETVVAYSNENINGLTMKLGTNPFLQYGTPEVVAQMRQGIADALEDFRTTPFSVTTLPNPAYDLGDLIQFSGGIGANSIGCIMAFTMRADCTIIEGYGENPALASARTKTDKEISGLIGRTAENEVIIHTFVNVEDITLGEDIETDIIEIHFATVNPKVVQILHEIKLDCTATSADGIMTCTVHYYLNDDELTYHPVTTWDNDGYHLLHLMYFLTTLENAARYDWRVALEISGGSATIEQDEARAALFGQGLVAVNSWDGEVKCDDASYVFTLGGDLLFNYMDETIVTDTKVPDTTEITDESYNFKLGGDLTFNYEADGVEIEQHLLRSNLTTENELYNLITEDGDYNIVTEGE